MKQEKKISTTTARDTMLVHRGQLECFIVTKLPNGRKERRNNYLNFKVGEEKNICIAVNSKWMMMSFSSCSLQPRKNTTSKHKIMCE